MSTAAAFRAEAARRILVKDGAYGTLIQAERLEGCGRAHAATLARTPSKIGRASCRERV